MHIGMMAAIIAVLFIFSHATSADLLEDSIKKWNKKICTTIASNPEACSTVVAFLRDALKWVSPADQTHNSGFSGYLTVEWEKTKSDQPPGASFWKVVTTHILPGFNNQDSEGCIASLAEILLPGEFLQDFSPEMATAFATPVCSIPSHLVANGSFGKGFMLFSHIAQWGMSQKNFQDGGFIDGSEQSLFLQWISGLKPESWPAEEEIVTKFRLLHTAFQTQLERRKQHTADQS